MNVFSNVISSFFPPRILRSLYPYMEAQGFDKVHHSSDGLFYPGFPHMEKEG